MSVQQLRRARLEGATSAKAANNKPTGKGGKNGQDLKFEQDSNFRIGTSKVSAGNQGNDAERLESCAGQDSNLVQDSNLSKTTLPALDCGLLMLDWARAVQSGDQDAANALGAAKVAALRATMPKEEAAVKAVAP